MAKEQTTTKNSPREIALVNLWEAQNIPGIANLKTLIAKNHPGLKIFKTGENVLTLQRPDFPDSEIWHVKSIVYK